MQLVDQHPFDRADEVDAAATAVGLDAGKFAEVAVGDDAVESGSVGVVRDPHDPPFSVLPQQTAAGTGAQGTVFVKHVGHCQDTAARAGAALEEALLRLRTASSAAIAIWAT